MAQIKNIQIDPELHHRVKLAAVMEGKTIRDYAEAALRAKLNGKRLVDPSPRYETEEA